MGKLRIGVIGGGGIAQAGHISSYKQYHDRAELTAIADISELIVKKNKDEHGFRHGFTDYREMLDKVELDAVSICTPTKFHAPATLAALQAGCHVLCEKPPAMNTVEARQMEAAAARAGKILTYGFMFRYSSEVQILKRFVDAGELGRIYTGRAVAMRRSGIPSWGAFNSKELSGGGPLIDFGIHTVDMALYLMGYPQPKSVMGATYQELGIRPLTPTWGGRWDPAKNTVEDLAVALVRFENGATLQVESCQIAHMKEMETFNVSLFGTEGGCNFSPLSISQDKHGTLIDITPAYVPGRNNHAAGIDAFLKAIEGEQGILYTPAQGVQTLRVVEGIYISAETNEPYTY